MPRGCLLMGVCDPEEKPIIKGASGQLQADR
jgi:hypothetical protein